MLPYTATLPCTGLGLRNNINGIIGDLRSNPIVMGVNQQSVAALFQQQNALQNALPVNVNNGANKDSQWLTLEVCREFQRTMCPRNELECKYAHPPPYIETQNGRVMCCYDSIKGKCHRIKPPCKYMHPPQHLKDLLIQNGKNNLLMKNLQMNLMQQQLSNLSGNPQSRLGFLSMATDNSKAMYSSQIQSPTMIPVITQKSNSDTHKLLSSSPDQIVDCSLINADQQQNSKSLHDNGSMANNVAHLQTNSNRYPNLLDTQINQCLPNNNSPGIPNSISALPAANEAISADAKVSRKRPLPANNANVNRCESSDKPSPLKKLNLLDSQLSGIGRESTSNPMVFAVNPLMAYQNQLAPYLSLNSQTALQSNPINLQTLLASNNSGLMSLGSGLMCPNTLINVNGFPLFSAIPNQQQHLATTLLQAANVLQYNRNLAEFSGFQ